MRHPHYSEILAQVGPLIDRISDVVGGQNVGLAAYALVNVLVACWRKIPLTREDLHEVLDEVWANAEVVAAERELVEPPAGSSGKN
jgi:hypothetical protein